ncbi:hypothetical protein GCM10023340_07420 [Nocardioides marinquilinus]|uniref:Uncharacterized protein n=1 Tax=Nocardioides marinquilinus TaxID=1210400 RepID=A0ABP9PEH8_9ACTN
MPVRIASGAANTRRSDEGAEAQSNTGGRYVHHAAPVDLSGPFDKLRVRAVLTPWTLRDQALRVVLTPWVLRGLEARRQGSSHLDHRQTVRSAFASRLVASVSTSRRLQNAQRTRWRPGPRGSS